MPPDHRAVLKRMFSAAVDAAAPAHCVRPYLPLPPKGHTVVVGAGKAAAAMAAAVEAHWRGPLEGLVVTRYGHGAPTKSIKVVEASHPVPDEAGPAAARAILDLVGGLSADDLVLALISGGGSALLALPGGEITLADKQAINRALLKSGAHIGEMNCVRKHLSAIKGGRLAAAAAPAKVVSLIISDVPGDVLSVIASGPTAADSTTLADARAVLEKYKIEVSPAVKKHLADPANETPKPGDPRLSDVRPTCSSRRRKPRWKRRRKSHAMRALRRSFTDTRSEGEARECGIVHAGIARQCAGYAQPAGPPCALISGGETTVTVRGKGRGGRNAEFLLSLALALDGHAGIWALAADTDGIDGSEDNAGAVIGPDTLERAARAGLNLRAKLADNDAYSAFAALDDLLVTGPTRTNVNDFRAILVAGRGR